MGRPGHHVDLYSTACRPYQALDDDGILVALVLDEQRVLRPVYKVGNTVAAVVITPDEARVLFSRVKLFPMLVGLEAGDNLGDLAAVRRRDRIVARLRQILRLPVERLNERRLVVHHIDFSWVTANAGFGGGWAGRNVRLHCHKTSVWIPIDISRNQRRSGVFTAPKHLSHDGRWSPSGVAAEYSPDLNSICLSAEITFLPMVCQTILHRKDIGITGTSRSRRKKRRRELPQEPSM